MKLKNILLAEDNPNDAELTITAFSELNLANRVDLVVDGVEVLEYLRCEGKFKGRKPEHPAVILLDIKMPRMNGIEVLQIIREDPELKFIPVVMLTSSREEQDLVQTYKLGINAYVVKPVDFSQFVDAVTNLGIFWALVNEAPGI